MCCLQPTKCVQCFLIIVIGLLGIALSFLLRCFVPGADVRISLAGYLTAVNVIAFFAFMLDKGIANGSIALGGDSWRFAENGLQLMIFFGGFIGAWLAMGLFSHKISKKRFLILALILTVVNLAWLFLWLIVTAKITMPKCYK